MDKDVEMMRGHSFQEFESLSGYEEEVVEIKTLRKTLHFRQHFMLSTDPLAETMQAVEWSTGRRSMGGRWLLLSKRRAGKLVSSVFHEGVEWWWGDMEPLN